jgi:hypothetical protein
MWAGKLSSISATAQVNGVIMRERAFWMITIMLMIWAALFLVAANALPSHAENPLAQHAADNNALATAERDHPRFSHSLRSSICQDTLLPAPQRINLRLLSTGRFGAAIAY